MRTKGYIRVCLIGLFLGMGVAWIGNRTSIDLVPEQVSGKQAGKEMEAKLEDKEPEPVISQLRDKEKCFLCGEKSKGLMSYYRKIDDLGLFCVNDWEVVDLQIVPHDREGNRTAAQGIRTRLSKAGEDSCSLQVTNIAARRIAEADINFDHGSAFDPDNAGKHLCQECLDRVLEAIGTGSFTDGEDAPRDVCLVDFVTLEAYPIQMDGACFTVRDYYVHVDVDDEGVDVIAVYVPVE